MRRPVRVLSALGVAVASALLGAACGTERISVPTSLPALHQGAVLFQQRCAGCHTLSYAATFGSAPNVFTAEFNNGPNFDVRCERPAIRVLYAIENGGFSGAIMPQNIVVGRDAIDVAKFVATYSGRQAPKLPGVLPCQDHPLGSIPAPTTAASASSSGGAGGSPGGKTGRSAGKSGSGGGKTGSSGGRRTASSGGEKSGGKASRHSTKTRRP